MTGDSSVKLGRASQASPMSLGLEKILCHQFRVLTLLVVPLPFLLLLCRDAVRLGNHRFAHRSTSETPSTMCGGMLVMVMSCVYASQSCLGRCSLHASPEGEGGGVHFQISCHPINTSHERCHNFSKICSECLAPLGSKAASSNALQELNSLPGIETETDECKKQTAFWCTAKKNKTTESI